MLLKKLLLVLIKKQTVRTGILLHIRIICNKGYKDGLCPPPKVLTMSAWAYELEHREIEEGDLVWWIMFSFTSYGWLGVCVAFLGNMWHQNELREEGKPAEAVWWVMFYRETLGHVIHMNTDSYHLPKHCCRPYTPSSWKQYPWWLWLPSVG